MVLPQTAAGITRGEVGCPQTLIRQGQEDIAAGSEHEDEVGTCEMWQWGRLALFWGLGQEVTNHRVDVAGCLMSQCDTPGRSACACELNAVPQVCVVKPEAPECQDLGAAPCGDG